MSGLLSLPDEFFGKSAQLAESHGIRELLGTCRPFAMGIAIGWPDALFSFLKVLL